MGRVAPLRRILLGAQLNAQLSVAQELMLQQGVANGTRPPESSGHGQN